MPRAKKKPDPKSEPFADPQAFARSAEAYSDAKSRENAELRERLAKAEAENSILRNRDVMSSPETYRAGVAGCSGTTTRHAGSRFLEDLDGGRLGPGTIPGPGDPPTSPGEAMQKARQGQLNVWDSPYNPGAEVYALSEVVRLHGRIDKLERMVRFLVERSG
jgi:hypothetical protein